MTPTIAIYCERIMDAAAEIGLRAVRAAGNQQALPADVADCLREALAAVHRAGEALDRAQAQTSATNMTAR
jgi:hypothetical protein